MLFRSVSNGDEAFRIIKNEISKAKSQLALGVTPIGIGGAADATLAAPADWEAHLNATTGAKAPSGAAAYGPLPVDADGIVGIAGAINAITVSTPNYKGLMAAAPPVKTVE